MDLKGITIQLLVKTESGRDAFNAPVYDEVWVNVDNVLVAPVSSTEALDILNLTGKKAEYNLGIPKGDTHDWEDCKVKFFGEIWRSVGFPQEGIEDLIPLFWNKKVMVERYG